MVVFAPNGRLREFSNSRFFCQFSTIEGSECTRDGYAQINQWNTLIVMLKLGKRSQLTIPAPFVKNQIGVSIYRMGPLSVIVRNKLLQDGRLLKLGPAMAVSSLDPNAMTEILETNQLRPYGNGRGSMTRKALLFKSRSSFSTAQLNE